MPSVKYNPMTIKHKKRNTSSTTSSSTSSILTNTKTTNTLFILSVILVVVLCIYLYVNYYNTKSPTNPNAISTTSTGSSLNTDSYDVNNIPSSNIVERFEGGVDDEECGVPFEQLSPSDQLSKCEAISSDIENYRNKLSGATFRFQKLDKFNVNNTDYFLLGNVGNGMVVEANSNDTSLKFATKDSTNDSQKFTKLTVPNSTDVYFVSKAASSYALQYEHDHLSLRTHNDAPFEGQKFVLLNEKDKALKSAVSFGLGKPHLNKDDLESKGPRTFVFLGSDGNATVSQSDMGQLLQDPALEQLTHDQLKEVVGNVLRDYNQFKQTENKTQGGVFGSKPLQFNVNLNDGSSSSGNVSRPVNVEGFENTNNHNHNNNKTNLDTFIDLRNSNANESLDVRSLLNRYSQQQQQMQSGGFASSAINNNNLSGIGSISKELARAAAGTSFQGCPKIDRSKYVTGRQVARCYGCNPDSSLQ